ncbi:uncharacterized protein LOC120883949 [Ictidomys tridecemlineatus]
MYHGRLGLFRGAAEPLLIVTEYLQAKLLKLREGFSKGTTPSTRAMPGTLTSASVHPWDPSTCQKLFAPERRGDKVGVHGGPALTQPSAAAGDPIPPTDAKTCT